MPQGALLEAAVESLNLAPALWIASRAQYHGDGRVETSQTLGHKLGFETWTVIDVQQTESTISLQNRMKPRQYVLGALSPGVDTDVKRVPCRVVQEIQRKPFVATRTGTKGFEVRRHELEAFAEGEAASIFS
jgi:hypothetical protein